FGSRFWRVERSEPKKAAAQATFFGWRIFSDWIGRVIFAPPLRPCHERHAEHFIIYPKISIAAVDCGFGADQRDFLRHHADILGSAPQIAVPVQAEPV